MLSALPLLLLACTGPDDSKPPGNDTWECQIPDGEAPNFAHQLGCQADFDTLASEPADSSIPGARSVKTVIDRVDEDTLYFQNSQKYCIHWDFASENLSGNGLPIVPDMSTFNSTEYYSPDRRFILGAVSWYDGPGKYVYEISPYDTADADMIATAFRKIAANMWEGESLAFHPTGAAVEEVAASLPADIPVISSEELYEGVDYQPLNTGTSTGILTFHTADEVAGGYTPYREVVVLDSVPNDISIVAGIITAEYQTPLAHINVLSVNRGTPNMALIGASKNEELLALEGKWVEFTVGAFDWTITEISQEEAEAWWDENRPDPLVVQPMELETTDLTAMEDILDLDTTALGDAISGAIPPYF